MADRIVSEKLLDEILLVLVTATHPRPYIEVTRLIERIHALPKKDQADDAGPV